MTSEPPSALLDRVRKLLAKAEAEGVPPPEAEALTAKAAEQAFVRRALASSALGRARALVLSGLLACAAAAHADEAETSVDAHGSDNSASSGSNAANNPVEPRLTLQYWNYYAPSLNNLNGDAENGQAKVLIPFQIAGVEQIMHIVSPVVTNDGAVAISFLCRVGAARSGRGANSIRNSRRQGAAGPSHLTPSARSRCSAGVNRGERSVPARLTPSCGFSRARRRFHSGRPVSPRRACRGSPSAARRGPETRTPPRPDAAPGSMTRDG